MNKTTGNVVASYDEFTIKVNLDDLAVGEEAIITFTVVVAEEVIGKL